jgi:hypothetical protein
MHVFLDLSVVLAHAPPVRAVAGLDFACGPLATSALRVQC